MMQAYFDTMAAGIEAKLAAAGPDDLIARKRLALESARLGSRLFSGSEPVAWCGVLTPFDLLHAAGVTSCFVEFVGATLAGTGGVTPLLDAAEHAGYGTDSCTFHRSVIGATLQGLMPEPAFLIATTAPCSGGVALLEDMARHFGRPLFVLNVPHEKDEHAVAYLAEQLQAMVKFVTGHTGQRLDTGRLGTAVEKTNLARSALAEAYRFAAAVPTPARRRDLINLGLVVALSFGTDAAIEIAEAYRDELRSKAEAGIAGVPGERVRLLWIQNRIQFRSPVEELLEELGAAVVVDELNDVNWDPIDPDDPFPGMARRMLSVCLTGGVDFRLDNMRRLCREYRVDGAVNPCHWGCRQGTGARGLLERGLRKIGVPVLNLEVDCVDERNFSAGPIRTRLQAFLEMVHERAAVRQREAAS